MKKLKLKIRQFLKSLQKKKTSDIPEDESIQQYIDRLFSESREMFEVWKRWTKIEFILVLTIIVSVIFTNNLLIILVAFNLWILVMISVKHFIDRPLDKKFGEIDGAIRILKLLGLIDMDLSDGKKDKEDKKALFERLKETWEKIKFVPKLQPQFMRIKI